MNSMKDLDATQLGGVVTWSAPGDKTQVAFYKVRAVVYYRIV